MRVLNYTIVLLIGLVPALAIAQDAGTTVLDRALAPSTTEMPPAPLQVGTAPDGAGMQNFFQQLQKPFEPTPEMIEEMKRRQEGAGRGDLGRDFGGEASNGERRNGPTQEEIEKMMRAKKDEMMRAEARRVEAELRNGNNGQEKTKEEIEKMMKIREEAMRKSASMESRRKTGDRSGEDRAKGEGRPSDGEGRHMEGEFEGEGDFGDFEGMDGEMMEDEMREEGLRHAKESLHGLEDGLKRMRLQMSKMEKAKIAVPEDIRALLSNLEKAAKIVREAQALDEEVEAALETIMEDGESLRDAGPRLGLIENVARAGKMIPKQIKRLRSALEKGKNAATRAKIDASRISAELELGLSGAEQALATAKAASENKELDGDSIETVMETMQDDVYRAVQKLERQVEIFKEIARLDRPLSRLERHLTTIEKASALLAKKGRVVTSITDSIAQARQHMAEAQGVRKVSPIDHYGVFSALSKAITAGIEAEEDLAEIRRVKTEIERAVSGTNSGAAAFLSNLLAPWKFW